MKTSFTPKSPLFLLICAALAAVQPAGRAYERYSSCAGCHGKFTEGVSTKGTVFPENNKHEMHRKNSYMNTDCALCHRSNPNDNHNPYIKHSDGVGGLPPIGCTGCHEATGLRAHHDAKGISECYECHNSSTPPPESTTPPYYGTAYTKANNPANGVLLSNTNENWSVGDFLGLDNDGDTLYDMADFDCGPYRVTDVKREGNNLRIFWQTAGGRKDIIQASPGVTGTYTDVSPVITIPGIGIVTTNYLEIGGASGSRRFYRVKNSP